MADTTKIIDPDNGAGTDYTSLAAWEADAQGWGSSGDTNTAQCRSSSGTADTSTLTLAGWVSGVEFAIEAIAGHEAIKTGIDTSRYRLSVGDAKALAVQVFTGTITGIQILNSGASQFTKLIEVGLTTWDEYNITFDSCYLFAQNMGFESDAFYIYDLGTSTIRFRNSFLRMTGSSSGNVGFNCNDSGATLTIYNSIVYGFTSTGILNSNGTVEVVNSAVFATGDDFSGTITITNCASDDGDGTNPVAPSGGDWANEFSDPANGDFTLLNTGNLYDAGVGPGSDANVPTTDIDGDARSGATCDIGADEYVAAGGETISATAADGISLGDSSSKRAILRSIAADGLSAGDGPPGSLGQFLAASGDGLSLSDQAQTIAGLFAASSDGVSLGDSVGRYLRIARTLSDAIAVGDAAAVSATLRALVSDGVILSETAAVIGTLLVGAEDGLIFSDATNWQGVISALVADGVSLSDATAAVAALRRSVADGVRFSDVPQVLAALRAQISDGVTFSDGLTGVIGLFVAAADGITLSDSAASRANLIGVSADGIRLSDAINVILTALAGAEDGMIFSDAATWAGIISALAADGIVLSDQAARLLQTFALAADGITLSDDGTVTATLRVNVADGVQLAETLAVVAQLYAAASDGITASDSTLYVTATLASGIVTITFTSRAPGITFTSKAPGVTFTTH